MNNTKQLFLNLVVAGIITAFAACGSPKSEGTYGQEFTPSNPISVDELVAQMGEQESAEVEVKGEITGVCKHEGCWIAFTTSGGEKIYINTKDKAFNLPASVMGKTAIARGTAFSVAKQIEAELANGEDLEDLDWITNVSVEATGIIVE